MGIDVPMNPKIAVTVVVLFLLSVVLFLLFNVGNRDGRVAKSSESALASYKYEKVYRNEAYGTRSTHQTFDFWSHDESLDLITPLVILVHSGAFITGDKTNLEMVELAETISSAGFKVASINYQLIPKPASLESIKNAVKVRSIRESWKLKIIEAIQDINLAVRYFRYNSDEFMLDPDRIFLVGYSAGAIASLNAAFLDSDDFFEYFDTDDKLCLDCLEPDITSDFKVRGVVSIGGAMFDRMAIDKYDNETSVLFIHGENDKMVSLYTDEPFNEYTDEDIDESLDFIINEFSLRHTTGEQEQEAWIFSSGIRLNIPKFYLQTLQSHLFPELHGPQVLQRRMKRNGIKSNIRIIKDSGHNLFYTERGTSSRNFGPVQRYILQFLNENQ